jgi:hypothetical protein
MPKIEPLFHDRQAIGKLMSGTKHKYIWRFKYDDTEYTIEFYKSKRGNRRIFMNGDKLLDVKRSETDGLTYRFAYKQGKVRMDLLIVKLADGEYDLRVGSTSFRAQMGRVKIARPTDELGKTESWETSEASLPKTATTFETKARDPWEARAGNSSDEEKASGRFGKQATHDTWQTKGAEPSNMNNPFGRRSSGGFDTRSKDPFDTRGYQDHHESSRKTISHAEAFPSDPWEKKAINIRPLEDDSRRRSPVKAAPLRRELTPPPQSKPQTQPQTQPAKTSAEQMNVFEMHKPQANYIPEDIFSFPPREHASTSYSTQQPHDPWMTSAQPASHFDTQASKHAANSFGNPFEGSPDKSNQGFIDPFEPSSGKSTEPSPGILEYGATGNQGDPFSKPKHNEIGSLVDLDNLHLGSNYSPAVAKKIMDANKPITVSTGNVPNIPMNQFQTEVKPSMMTNPMMANPMMANPMMANAMMTGNPMMANPMMTGNPMMANVVAMNQYMTGMMMSQMMNNQYMQPK